MKILFIGQKSYINLYLQSLVSESHLIDVYYWDNSFGPELVIDGHIDNYDCIIIFYEDASLSNDLCEIVKCHLSNKNTQIINAYKCHQNIQYLLRSQKCILNPQYSYYDGLILGISHAEVGILADRLNGNWCNLAMSSQDLFYNFQTLNFAINNHFDKIKNIKTIIIDMYDYNIFNYDLSLSHNYLSYIMNGGYPYNPHNFSHNSRIDTTYETIIKYKDHFILQNSVPSKDYDTWLDLFPAIYSSDNYSSFQIYIDMYSRAKMLSQKEIDEYKVSSSIALKEYPATISENKMIFQELLGLIYSTWPSINVLLTLLPIPTEISNKRSNIYKPWENIFNDIINSFSSKYPFHFKSFSYYPLISNDYRLFYDCDHLNYIGAYKFTKILQKWIDEFS